MALQDLAQLKAAIYWRDPIIIVGAGLTGMITALGLARYNVPCILLDDDTGPSLEGSRAFLINQHTLDILGSWSNLAQQITQQGITLTGERLFVRKSTLYSMPIASSQPGARYPSFVNISQSVLEHGLYSALQAIPGCQVLWQHKVIGITQDSDGVNVEVQTPWGVKYLRAPYILAADGSQSTVRNLLGISIPVTSNDYRILTLDVQMQGAEPPNERYFWFDPPFNPGHIAQLNPLPGKIYRLDYQLSAQEDPLAINQSATLHERIVATIGQQSYQLVWKNIHTYRQQLVERFISGRVLLLGDAAHVLSPFGYDGLNSGVQDAWNLVWKLVLVRAGQAQETLLDTYQNERHAANKENLRLADETMRFMEPPTGLAHWKRNTNLRLSQPFKFMRKHLLVDQLNTSFMYRDSPVTSDDHRLYLGGRFTKLPAEQSEILKRFRQSPVVGSPAPSVVLLDADMGIPVPLSDYFGRGFVAFCFCADVEMGILVLERLQENLSDIPIELCLISQSLPATTAIDGIQVFLDEEGKAASAYNAGPRSLYLIRPDGYIAARRFDSDFNDISALVRHAVGEDVVDTQTRLRKVSGAQ
ncbi:MAG TPA: FAD-dependent monooxygenase [Ktedonobacteraceae bacterium]